MPNLRIIADNAIDRATITADSAVSTLPVTNLKTNVKSSVWRSTGLAAQVNAAWASPESVSAVAMPFTNLSDSATMRTRVSTEASSTNRLVYSDHYYSGGTGMSLSGASFALYATEAPEGSKNATKLVEGVANTLHEAYKSFTSLSGQRSTVSVFMKAGERTKSRFGQVTGGFVSGATAIFDLTTGTVSAVTQYGTQTGATARITSEGNGWYRCSIDLYSSGNGPWYISNDLVTGTNTITYLGDGTSGLYFIHMQQEAGPLTSFYPSTTSFSSRTSTGTYFGSNGVLQTVGNNVARMQYNPLNLAAPPFLLLEPTATNIFPYSEGTIAQAGGSNVANASITIPGFANTLQFGDNSLARYSYRAATASTTVGSVYTLSVFMAMDDGGMPVIGPALSGTADFSFVYEGSVFVTANVTHVGNGVYRVSRSVTAVGTGHTSNGVVKYTTQSARGFRVTGYQLELGAYPSSYIPTAAAGVTRAADNANSSAGIRPAGYIDTWQSYDYDTGYIKACPGTVEAGSSVNTFAYGKYSAAVSWLPKGLPAYGVAINISDPTNPSGYIESSKLVIGDYWTPTSNAEHGGMSQSMEDSSQHYRTDAGDLLTYNGTRHKKISLSVNHLTPTERASFWRTLKLKGLSNPVFLSVFPEDKDGQLEQDFQVFGKMSSLSPMQAAYFERYSTSIDIEEI